VVNARFWEPRAKKTGPGTYLPYLRKEGFNPRAKLWLKPFAKNFQKRAAQEAGLFPKKGGMALPFG